MIYVKNYMEELVKQQLDEVLSRYQICTCDKCKSDIIAIALNILPTMYVSTDKGQALLKANLLLAQQLKADILAAIAKGVDKVRIEVRHNITLIGFMGSGKTTIGKQLAHELGYEWMDLDLKIEQEQHQKITDLFKNFGEDYFRKLETSVLQQACQEKGQVISTGGGVISREENRRLLQSTRCIYLKWEFDTLYNRIANDSERPLVKSYEQLLGLFNQRQEAYLNSACQIINCENKTIPQIISEIQRMRGEYNENSTC